MRKAMVQRNEVPILKEEYRESGLTLEAFIGRVQRETAGEKRRFIPAVYKILDEFLGEEKRITGINLACKKGCSLCCKNVLLACTEPEIDTVISFIHGLSRHIRTTLLKKIKQYAREWGEYYAGNELILKTNSFRAYRDWQRPCVFLDEESSCAIYPARIIDCRIYTSLAVCSPETPYRPLCPIDYPGPGSLRFESELWANNLILGQVAKGLEIADPRFVPITPVLHWLLLKKNNLY